MSLYIYGSCERPEPSGAPARDPRPSPAARRLGSRPTATPSSAACRPSLVGVPVTAVVGMAALAGDRQDRHRRWVVAQRLPTLLDLEIPPGPDRTARRVEGRPGSHPADEPRESALGRAAHSRRVAQARHHRLAADGVHFRADLGLGRAYGGERRGRGWLGSLTYCSSD